MHRIASALFACLLGTTAYAQTPTTPTLNGLTVTGTTTLNNLVVNGTATLPATGTIQNTATTFNITDPAQGLKFNGITYYKAVPGNNGVPGFFLGPYAGNAAKVNGAGTIGIGASALELISKDGAETVAIGPLALRHQVNGGANVAVGQSVMWHDDPVGCVGVGMDVMRDTVGCVGATVVGSGSYIDGASPDVQIFGRASYHGSAGTILLAGAAPTVGDVYSIRFTSPNAQTINVPATATYTVKAGDTLATLSTGIQAAIMAINPAPTWNDPTGVAPWGLASPISLYSVADLQGNQHIGLHMPGGSNTVSPLSAQLQMTGTCTGTCSATITILPETTGVGNVIVGGGIMVVPGITTASYNTLIGKGVAARANQDFSYNTCVGYGACTTASTDKSNVALGRFALWVANGSAQNTALGTLSGQRLTQGTNNVFVGYTAGGTVTTGSSNVCIGTSVCNAVLTTGSNNIIIGTGGPDQVDVADRSNLIQIGRVLKFTNVSVNPPVISACGTSPSVDSAANMVSGTVTAGTGTVTGCTIQSLSGRQPLPGDEPDRRHNVRL
jgi:hypothetical protein